MDYDINNYTDIFLSNDDNIPFSASWYVGYGGNIFNWFFIIIFSLYIGYDWHVAQSYSKTVDNAIDSAIDLYLDLINLFLRILDILDRK